MAQGVGKLKKNKKSHNTKPFHRRANAPVKPKKNKHNEAQKLKGIMTKTVNKFAESEIRSMADSSKFALSSAQESTKKHNATKAAESIEAVQPPAENFV